MKVYQRLAADFVAEGVTHIFGIMGDGNMYWMHELDKLGGVKMLEVRHEGVRGRVPDVRRALRLRAQEARTPLGQGVGLQQPRAGVHPPRSVARGPWLEPQPARGHGH